MVVQINSQKIDWIDLPAEKDLPDEEKEGMLIIPYCYDCNGVSLLPNLKWLPY